MTFNRSAVMAALLALAACGPVFAHGGGRPGAAPGRGGGHSVQMPHQQQHMVTPEMQHQMMMNQFVWGPLMYDIWLQDQRAAAKRKLAQPPVDAASSQQQHAGANQTHRLTGAVAAPPANNQPRASERRHADARHRDGATGLVQADPALVLADQQPTEPEETPDESSMNDNAEGLQATEPQETGESASENASAENQQATEPQAMSGADDRSGNDAAQGQKNGNVAAGNRRVNRAVISEAIQFAQDQEIIDVLKSAHAMLRGAGNDYADHRDRALERIATALSQLYPWVTLPSAALDDLAQQTKPGSDRVLRATLHDLDKAETSLRTMPDRAPRHEKARAAVAAARNELNAALGSR